MVAKHELGPSDPPARRLWMADRVLGSANLPPAQNLVVFKIRPVRDNGAADYMHEFEYAEVRSEIVPTHAPEAAVSATQRGWLLHTDGESRVV
jgi:hypothetical protein